MGLQIIIPGVAFTKYADIVSYPVPDALTSLHYLGGSAGASCANKVAGGVDATVAGTITYQPAYATFAGAGQTNHLQSAEYDSTDDVTFVAVMRMPTALSSDGRGIFSAVQGGDSGANLFHQGLFHSNGSDFKYPLFTGVDNPGSETDFHFRAGVVAGVKCRAYSVSGSSVVLGQELTAASRGKNTTRPLRIGGDYVGSGYDDTADIAMVAKHGQALTVDQLQLIYRFLRSYYAKRGITLR